jgi:hypothetical protein
MILNIAPKTSSWRNYSKGMIGIDFETLRLRKELVFVRPAKFFTSYFRLEEFNGR